MSTQLIILGMHRSGTSLTGQAIEAMGFRFGPEHLAVAAKNDNPLGYWERKDVGTLNGDAFAALGKVWELIGSWEIGKLPASFLDEFDRRAREIVASFPPGKPWFVKDPRMCVTLPLWEKYFENPVYLFAYRDPVEICRSLWSRNHHPPSLVMALWERYLGDALNATRGKKRLMIRYSDLLNDPRGTLADLYSGLQRFGVEPACSLDAVLDRIIIDDKLRHHQRSEAELEISFTASQEALNRHLLDGTAFDLPGLVDVSQANRQMNAHEAIKSFGRPWEIVGKEPSPAGRQSLSHLAEEIKSGNSRDALAFAGQLLKSGSIGFVERGRDALQVLEPLYSLHLHLRRPSPFSEISSDYETVILVKLCNQLLGYGPFFESYKTAREEFSEFTSNPPDRPLQFIKRSNFKPGMAWAKALVKMGEPVERLMSEIILGKLPLLEAIPIENPKDAAAVLDRFHSSVKESVLSVQAALDVVRVLIDVLEPKKKKPEEVLLKEPPDDPERRREIKQLREWAEQFCHHKWLSFARFKARRQFRSYQAKGTFKPLDQERVRIIGSLATTAERRLTALLTDLEQAIELVGVIDAGINVPEIGQK